MVDVSVNDSWASLQYIRISNLVGKPIESKNYQIFNWTLQDIIHNINFNNFYHPPILCP